MYHCVEIKIKAKPRNRVRSTQIQLRRVRSGREGTHAEDEREGTEDADGEAEGHHVVHGVVPEHLGREAAPRDAVRYRRVPLASSTLDPRRKTLQLNACAF